jgi:pseudaminic acid synthase
MATIGHTRIGPGQPVFIVAELSGNHNGDINRAFKIIDAAADAGADAIKLQTYTPDTITIDSDTEPFMVTWKGKRQKLYALYTDAHTPWEWQEKLFAHAKNRGLVCFSTPFDETAVTFLKKLHAPMYKVASFEVVDIPLLEAIGKTKKPVIMSRGMATLEELTLAVKTLRKFGTKDIITLQCTSAYPAEPKDMRLSMIPDLRKRFGVPVGLSDHTLSEEVTVAAVAFGAVVVEKHLTLRRADGGPDAEFSLEPDEFAHMVKAIRTTEEAIGKPSYARRESEGAMLQFRRSLFVVKDMKKGEHFTKENVRSIRPGNGMSPKFYRSVLGKRAARDLKRATPLKKNLIT